jgi:hypothetical protein
LSPINHPVTEDAREIDASIKINENIIIFLALLLNNIDLLYLKIKY